MFSAAPTPFDLNFPFFGIPVRVHPLFWLFMALLGWNPDDLQSTLIWVMAGFLSILGHELGHALTTEYFGQRSSITLYAFGGYATHYPFRGTWRNVAVVAAGPAVSFAMGGLAVLALYLIQTNPDWLPQDEGVRGNIYYFVFSLAVQGIVWGIFNILPIYPMDGGQITRYLFVRFRPLDGARLSLQISLLLAIALAIYFFQGGSAMTGMLMASMALSNWQELQGSR
jgi:stage IV sporulation protein FB